MGNGHFCTLKDQFKSELDHGKEFREEVRGDVSNIYGHITKIKDRLSNLETKVAFYGGAAGVVGSVIVIIVEKFIK